MLSRLSQTLVLFSIYPQNTSLGMYFKYKFIEIVFGSCFPIGISLQSAELSQVVARWTGQVSLLGELTGNPLKAFLSSFLSFLVL